MEGRWSAKIGHECEVFTGRRPMMCRNHARFVDFPLEARAVCGFLGIFGAGYIVLHDPSYSLILGAQIFAKTMLVDALAHVHLSVGIHLTLGDLLLLLECLSMFELSRLA